MVSFSSCDRASLQTASLSGSIRNSTFVKYCSAEAALEKRMRMQREARLQRPRADVSAAAGISFIDSLRFPQRWTDE